MSKPAPIIVNGHKYPSKAAFADHLARHYGVVRYTALNWLNIRGLTPVEAEARAKAVHRAAKAPAVDLNENSWPVCLNGHSFASMYAFSYYLQRYYGIGGASIYRWRKDGLSLGEIVKRARQQHARRSKGREPTSGELVITGWRFSSFTALCDYYGFPRARRFETFRYHEGTLFEFFLQDFGKLWSLGLMLPNNRWPEAREARMPKSCLPLNTDPEEMSDIERISVAEIPGFKPDRATEIRSLRARAGLPIDQNVTS